MAEYSKDRSALKRKVLRTRRDAADGIERLRDVVSEDALAAAQEQVAATIHRGDSTEIERAIGAEAQLLRRRDRELSDRLLDPNLADTERARLMAERDRDAERSAQLAEQIATLPDVRDAEISESDAAADSARYRTDLRQYGTGAQTATDLDAERAELSAAVRADEDAAQTSDGGLARARLIAGADRLKERTAAVDLQQDEFAPPPELQAALIEDRGELERSQRYVAPGSERAIRLQLIANLRQTIALLTAQHEASENGEAGDAAYEKRLQPLLTEEAAMEHASQVAEIRRLPDMTVGGVSHRWQTLPSVAEEVAQRAALGLGPVGTGSLRSRDDPIEGRTLVAHITIIGPPGTPTQRHIVPLTLSKDAQTPRFANGSAGPGQR